MRRRTFLSSSVAAGLGAVAWSAETVHIKPGDIPERVFGKTGERLTIIGQAGGRFPMCSYEDAKAITLRALGGQSAAIRTRPIPADVVPKAHTLLLRVVEPNQIA